MLKRSLIESFDKYVSLSGGGLWRIVSPLLAGVACFALGFLLGGAYKDLPAQDVLAESACESDNCKGESSYPVHNLSIKGVASLIDIEAKAIKDDVFHQNLATASAMHYEELAAISSMQMVNAFISDYRTPATQNSICDCQGNAAEKGWYLSVGSCGIRSYIMMEIMFYLNIPAREIQFWHIDGNPFSHVACEIYYNDSWHYFDPTWGLYFRDLNDNILSLEEILELPKDEAYSCLVMDYSNMNNALNDFRTNPYNLLETDAEIGIAGNAAVSIDFNRDESLSNLPNFIGVTHNWNGEYCENKYIVIPDDEIEKVIIYYDWCSLSKIDFKDEEGYCIKSVDEKDCNGKIELDADIMSYGAVTIETQNKEMPNFMVIKKIEAVYGDGTRKILE